MFVYVPHRPNRECSLRLEPGERMLNSYIDGALGYTWLVCATALIIAAIVVVLFISPERKAMMSVASVLSANMLLFAALGKRKLHLTDRRLVLVRCAKQVQSVELGDVSGIDVRGGKVGRITVKSLNGSELSASVYDPLKVAAAVQAACAAANGKETELKGGRE